MTNIPANDSEPPKLPRWAQIIAGLFLLPISVVCLAGSLVLVLSPPDKAPILAMSLGAVFVLLCLWVLWLAVRLLANRPGHGLLGPFALRASALLFFILPVVGLFTGYWQQKPFVAAAQTICYLVIAATLWQLAKGREHAA